MTTDNQNSPVAPQGDEDDSLLLCASDLQHSAIYDSHSEMQDCARSVADRIKALAARALAAPALEAPAAPAPAVPDGWRLVPIEFLRGFGTLAHNYSLTAIAPDHYWGNERSAFSDAYARCGQDLTKLRDMLSAEAPPLAAAPQAPAAPEDPMDWPLPCDVTVGHGTIRKGCKLRTLVLRMQVLYNLAQKVELAEPASESPAQAPHSLTVSEAVAEFREVCEAARSTRAAQAAPAAPAVDALAPVQALLDVHAALLDANPYAYFELAYTRQTGWMAWITDKPFHGPVINPDRKVLARGQGDTASEACAAAAQAKEGGDQ